MKPGRGLLAIAVSAVVFSPMAAACAAEPRPDLPPPPPGSDRPFDLFRSADRGPDTRRYGLGEPRADAPKSRFCRHHSAPQNDRRMFTELNPAIKTIAKKVAETLGR